MNAKETNRVSLALNILLAMICVGLAFRRRATEPILVPPTPSQAMPAEAASAHSKCDSTSAEETPARAEPRSWIEVLRSQNVPEKTIARLAMADFDDRWESRQAAAQEAYNRGDIDSDGLAALEREREIGQEEDLRTNLGEEAFHRWDQERLFQQFNLHNTNLTPAESASLYQLAANLRQHLRGVDKERQKNRIDQATYSSEQAAAQSDFEKQLRTLLGDERYSTLRGTDSTVGQLRRSLRGVNLDDQQFATLLQAQEQCDTSRAQLSRQIVENGDTNLQQRIDALGAQRDQTFASILGTNGLALYERQQDSRYLELEKNAPRWGLDNSNIDYIWAAIEMYEKAHAEYESKLHQLEVSGIKLDPESTQQSWRKYQREMTQYVRTSLTEAQYEAITQNHILPFANP